MSSSVSLSYLFGVSVPQLENTSSHDDVLHGDGHVRSHIRHHGRDDDVHVPRGHGHVRSHIPRHVRDGDVRVRPHRGHDGGRVRPHRDDDHSSTPRRHDGDDARVHVPSCAFSAASASISSSRFVTFSMAPKICVPSKSSQGVVIICALA